MISIKDTVFIGRYKREDKWKNTTIYNLRWTPLEIGENEITLCCVNIYDEFASSDADEFLKTFLKECFSAEERKYAGSPFYLSSSDFGLIKKRDTLIQWGFWLSNKEGNSRLAFDGKKAVGIDITPYTVRGRDPYDRDEEIIRTCYRKMKIMPCIRIKDFHRHIVSIPGIPDSFTLGDFYKKSDRVAVGDVFSFGKSSGKDINWIVVQVNGSEVRCLSKDDVLRAPYDSTDRSKSKVSWEGSTLKKTLDDFIPSIFQGIDQSPIIDISILSLETARYIKDNRVFTDGCKCWVKYNASALDHDCGMRYDSTEYYTRKLSTIKANTPFGVRLEAVFDMKALWPLLLNSLNVDQLAKQRIVGRIGENVVIGYFFSRHELLPRANVFSIKRFLNCPDGKRYAQFVSNKHIGKYAYYDGSLDRSYNPGNIDYSRSNIRQLLTGRYLQNVYSPVLDQIARVPIKNYYIYDSFETREKPSTSDYFFIESYSDGDRPDTPRWLRDEGNEDSVVDKDEEGSFDAAIIDEDGKLAFEPKEEAYPVYPVMLIELVEGETKYLDKGLQARHLYEIAQEQARRKAEEQARLERERLQRQYEEEERKRKELEERERIEQERVRRANEEKLRAERMAKGLCTKCGGKFKGLFKKTCSHCGCKKDY